MYSRLSYRNIVEILAVLASAAVLVLLGGFVAARGDIRIVLVVSGALVGAALLSRPSAALTAIVVSALMIVGAVTLYAPSMQIIRWAVSVFAAGLGALALLSYVFEIRKSHSTRLSPVAWWYLAFGMFALVSSLISFDKLPIFVFGLKGYFQMLGLALALVLTAWHHRVIDRIPGMLVAIAFLQLPFVLHQHFFIVPQRIGIGGMVVPEDVIAGTMGADALGGGANSVLSILLLIAVAIFLALHKRKALSTPILLVSLPVLLLPIVLNANKIAIVYLVMIFFILFWKEVVREPGRFLFTATLALGAAAIIVWSYTTLLSSGDGTETWRDLVDSTIQSNFAHDEGHGGFSLNRTTTLLFWAEEHRDGPLKAVIAGHGIGQSRQAEGGALEPATIAIRYYLGVGIGLSAISGLLWEVGIIGLALLCCFFVSAWRAAGRLARIHEENVRRSCTFYAFQAMVPVFGLSLFLKNSFLHHLPYQTLLFLVFGYIAFWDTRSRNESFVQADMLRRVQHSDLP